MCLLCLEINAQFKKGTQNPRGLLIIVNTTVLLLLLR